MPRGFLTEERIVAASLAILARDGLGGLGMRSVAQELGTAPMSLYRHVRSRDALLALVSRHVMAPGEAVPPEPLDGPGAWRSALRALLHGARAQLRRHRGAVALFDSTNFRQPPASSAVERALVCLGEAGLDDAQAARASAALWMYTVGAVLAEQSAVAAWPGEDIPPDQRARWVDEMQGAIGQEAPRTAAMTGRWVELSHEAVFSEGLELLLAGIEASAKAR